MEDECVEELGRPISSMKVTELRDELIKRSLTRTGNKKELIDRLRLAIQRQSSQQTSGIEQSNQIIQQQQQQSHQNVPQYINAAAVAIQQNQVAYQQQMNQIQPQAQLAAYTIPLNQQQYQQTMMQSLDLQQQLADYQNQVQFASAEYQQQQLIADQQQQPQQQSQQQYQPVSQAPPPIDMRVLQQGTQPVSVPVEPTQMEKTNEQSIDLSNNNKEQQIEKPSVAPTMLEVEQQKQESSTDLGKIEQTTSQLPDQLDSMIEKQTETASPNAQLEVERPKDEEAKTIDSEDLENVEQKREPEITEEKTQSSVTVDQVQPTDKQEVGEVSTLRQTEEVSNKEQTETDALNQASFSLKRTISCVSSSSGQGSKEKKRKWSSKASEETTKTGFSVDLSQANLVTGGISSQKLQELIVEKPSATVVKNIKQVTKDDSNSDAKVVGDEAEDRASDAQEESKSVSDPSSQDKKIEKNSSPPEPNAQESQLIAQETEIEPTNILLVQNLVRPFTLPQLKEVLTKHGSINEDNFWTDKVKSKCCVMYESVDVAKLTRESLNGQQWPSSNPKTLKVSYITEETLSQYQKSGHAKASVDNSENGHTAEQTGKSITERLGQKLVEGGEGGDHVKKRLGERVTGEISAKSSNINRDGDNSKPQELDDLFRKTKSVPHLFWQPLTESQADLRQKERSEREARSLELQKSRRSPPGRRSPVRHRSPARQRFPARRRSPMRHRSRSPVSRRSPIRNRSPAGRRSPLRRSSPPRRRSPMQSRRSPGPYRSPMRRSPIASGRSPLRRSPGPIRRLPGPPKRSPDQMRRSPGISRRSPVTMRRSPQLIRRSPAPIRGSSPMGRSPVRKRSPLLRRQGRTPPRHLSPRGAMGGYAADQRRPPQRPEHMR